MVEDDGRSRGRRERLHVPPGHYYSPIPSEPDITRAIGGATAPDSAVPAQLPGIDLRGTEQLEMLASWLPAYVNDNRSYLTVAIGCTGGQHRSVYFAEWLGHKFDDQARVLIRHRTLAGG